MKPVTFTTDPNMVVWCFVGNYLLLWEPSVGAVYQSGQVGLYLSRLTLLPDNKIRFTDFTARTEASADVNMSNKLASIFVPALESATRTHKAFVQELTDWEG